MTYIPGFPHKLSFVNPSDGHISIPNGETLDPIILAVYDEYGNRCAPNALFGSKWDILLGKNGPFSNASNKYHIQTDGLATLNGLRIELEDVAYPGSREVQTFLLDWPAHLGGGNDSPISEDLIVTVIPGTKPNSMEVINILLSSPSSSFF